MAERDPEHDLQLPQTMAQLLGHQAARHPTKPMLIAPHDRIGYADLDASSRVLAAAFVDAGVRKGTRVGLVMPNGIGWAQIAAAVTRIGAVLVPLSTLLPAAEMVAHLRAASVRYLVSVSEFRGHRYLDELGSALPDAGLHAGVLHRAELPALRRVWAADDLLRVVPGAAAARLVGLLGAAVRPSDALAVIFTSGSRSAPKGVIHSHQSAFGAVRSGLADRCIDADTRLYIPMPFFWTGGFAGGLLSALLAGATLVTEAIPEPEATLRLLDRERVTLFRGWPDQAEALADHRKSTPVASLRPGSLDALLPAHLRSRPGARANLFGMTESFGPYCGYRLDTDMPPSAWGSCGRPFSGTQVRIVDAASGQPVPPGAPGEIEIRGPHTLRGICRRGREEVFTVDGFYPTGDLGHIDNDGFLFYHDRSDDMFKVRGATVYPSEIERALQGIDVVDKAYVMNLPGPHGNRVAAAVVCNEPSTKPEQLRTAAATLLSAFKVPSVWLVLDSHEVPRTATGKVDSQRLRRMLRHDA
jgi:acyl-CoA synthetase (AMP-forming)/AMP-acid ligase II